MIIETTISSECLSEKTDKTNELKHVLPKIYYIIEMESKNVKVLEI